MVPKSVEQLGDETSLFIISFCFSHSSREVIKWPLKRFYNHAAITEAPDLRHVQLFSASSPSVELWCGILPESWAATWPNVVQMVVFTVFGGTGTTLQLAWQGFVGTSCACLNAFLMSVLFPHGGRAELCTEPQRLKGECQAGGREM